MIATLWENIYQVLLVTVVTVLAYKILLSREKSQTKEVVTTRVVPSSEEKSSKTLVKELAPKTTPVVPPTTSTTALETAPPAQASSSKVTEKLSVEFPSPAINNKQQDVVDHQAQQQQEQQQVVVNKKKETAPAPAQKVATSTAPPTGLIADRLSRLSEATSNRPALNIATSKSGSMMAKRRPKTRVNLSETLKEADIALSQVQSVNLPDPSKEHRQTEAEEKEEQKRSLDQVIASSGGARNVNQNAMKMASLMNVNVLADLKSKLKKTE